jgi:protein-disulfide isomerase
MPWSTSRRGAVLYGMLSIAMVLTTTALVRRELTRGTPTSNPPTVRTIEDGARVADDGIVLGDSAARVRIVEFSDFECPFCRQIQSTLATLRAKHPQSVAIVYRHFPLSRIGFAVPAAIAAECAANQGRFEAFAALLFASQDTLARLAMERVAAKAGVPDTARFRTCRSSSAAKRRVDADIAAGLQIGIEATPTLLIGDRLVVGNIPLERLEAMVRASLEANPAR